MARLPEFHASAHMSTVERLLVNQLLWMLFLRVVLYTLILGVSVYLQGTQVHVAILPQHLLLIFIIVVYVSSIISSLLLLNTEGNHRRFGIKQNLLDTFFVSLLVYLTGASLSIFAPIYFFPIIAGGLILPRLGGLVAAGASTLQFGFALALGYYNFFPDFLGIDLPKNTLEGMATLNMFAVYGLTFFLAAILASLFAGRLRKTEDALSDSVRDFDRLSLLYKQIFDDINTGIITTDEYNRISSVNNAACNITGFSLNELLHQDFHKFFPNVTFTSQAMRHSAKLLRKDDEVIRVGYSYAKLQYLQPDDTRPTTQDMEEPCKDCKVVTIKDISEVERLEKQMQQAEKLAAIGRMSAGIAHDFRNPLTAISGSAQVLVNEISRTHSPQQQQNLELINIILRESNRLSNTVSDFLKFARPDNADKDWFSLRRCLEEVIEVAKAGPMWPKDWEVEIDIDSVVDVWADKYQLFTILNHLLQNAQAFTPIGKERIRIIAKEIQDEDRVEISVEDNGPGISAGKETKIFEPFYTRRVDGTGLGLAIVKQMVQEHQGEVWVSRSSLGGAKFTISLPLA